MATALLVIPCYNEADRLPADRFVEFTAHYREIAFLFVNDGSTDRTQGVLDELTGARPAQLRSMTLDRNLGKAEAVRAGMLSAIGMDPEYVGFWDADLSTPLEEIPRFIELYRAMPDKIMLSGARVKLMGKHIERRAARHYTGRVFATVASTLLDIHMYDTQCGAKLFRRTPGLAGLFETSFRSRWLFDLELIQRMRARPEAAGAGLDALIYEVPLNTWRDTPGSKVSYADFARAVFDLLVLRFSTQKRDGGIKF